MKKIFLLILCMICLSSCAREPSVEETILGGWTNKTGDAYIYLKIKMESKWESSVKLTDSSLKIIQVKGTASGEWHIEDNTLVLTVFESNIDKFFKKNATNFYEIIKLDDNVLQLMDANGRTATWQAVKILKNKADGDVVISIKMEPFTINLNKTRSRDKDRYLCLALNIVLKEIMPGESMQKIHPKAREAVLLYLSSLVYKDVQNLDQIKELQGKLRTILNPYMGNMVDKVEIDHVILATTIDRVEEFLIEHSLKARISKKQDGAGNKKDKGK